MLKNFITPLVFICTAVLSAGLPAYSHEIQKFPCKLPGGLINITNECGPRTSYWNDFAQPDYLIVYFHGLNSHEFEAYSVPDFNNCFAVALRRSGVKAALLSINLSPQQSFVTGEVSTLIDEPVKSALKISGASKIIIYGGSMGAFKALSYLSEGADEILQKISAVAAIEPPDDLDLLAKESSLEAVRNAVTKVLVDAKPSKTTIEQILQEAKYKPNILVVSATNDTVVPPAMQTRIVKFLQENGFATKFMEIPGNHGILNLEHAQEALDNVTSGQ